MIPNTTLWAPSTGPLASLQGSDVWSPVFLKVVYNGCNLPWNDHLAVPLHKASIPGASSQELCFPAAQAFEILMCRSAKLKSGFDEGLASLDMRNAQGSCVQRALESAVL